MRRQLLRLALGGDGGGRPPCWLYPADAVLCRPGRAALAYKSFSCTYPASPYSHRLQLVLFVYLFRLSPLPSPPISPFRVPISPISTPASSDKSFSRTYFASPYSHRLQLVLFVYLFRLPRFSPLLPPPISPLRVPISPLPTPTASHKSFSCTYLACIMQIFALNAASGRAAAAQQQKSRHPYRMTG
jgi:hypothetical protein